MIEVTTPKIMGGTNSRKDDLQEIKEKLHKFEELLSQNVLIRNPEYEAYQQLSKNAKSEDRTHQNKSGRGGKSNLSNAMQFDQVLGGGSTSGTTIYKNAVPKLGGTQNVDMPNRREVVDGEVSFNFRQPNQIFSSDEELLISSDEFNEIVEVEPEQNFAEEEIYPIPNNIEANDNEAMYMDNNNVQGNQGVVAGKQLGRNCAIQTNIQMNEFVGEQRESTGRD